MLVVDDNKIARALLQKFLAPLGELEFAEDGAIAVEAFERALESDRRFDLICLNVVMPNVDGHETLRRIRRAEKDRGIARGSKIVMTSGMSDPRSILTAFEEKCDAYLVKPITREKLTSQLEALELI